MKNLVIVESPTKAKTITKFLGKDYTIKFSMGHVMDLPKSKLGIAISEDFAPQYEVVADKQKLIAELRAAAKGADSVLLATDPDREGEAISANIQELLMGGKSNIAKDKFKRIVFHEITETAIKEALTHPRDVDMNLVDSQTARRVLDRLVGYQISPVLWKKIRRGLSAGRVQSVALRLIVEREKEIKKFEKQPYWTIHTLLLQQKKTAKKDAVDFELLEINGKRIEVKQTSPLYVGEYTVTKTSIVTEEKAAEIVSDLQNKIFTVAEVNQRQMKRSPYPPFTTSTLQQDASRRFGFSGKRTMSLAQKLYEEGYITYHRTDSVILSTAAIDQMRTFLDKEFGQKYLPAAPRVYSTKQKLAQEAHEGIRPTKVGVHEAVVSQDLGRDYAKLYDLIWRRALASQMADALIESTTVHVDAISAQGPATPRTESSYRLKASGSVLVFDGFLKLNPQALKDTQLPQFTSEEILNLQEAHSDPHETLPPPRYNDASLIATLEEKGIGRPSTYASIISTLVDRGYVERVEKRFEGTPVGMAVSDFLVKNFSTIDDIPFTAQMESQLDDIAQGEKNWVVMMKEFYQPFEKSLIEVGGAERVKIETEETEETCPECGAPVVIRFGKFGKFFSCSRFPDCRFTKQFVESTNVLCPKDGGAVIIKKTRKGRKFFGCANYPKCDFAAWKLEDITGKPTKTSKVVKANTASKKTTKKS
ncbi:MAG: type I DNA topoisomerase [Patescibacteria group bacterium]